MKMKYEYAFTVFTPSFNRAHTLHRVWDSLKAQTFRNFEWLIVDDGSTDNTEELVRKWQKETDFPIRYFYQDNQGKHIAFNRAVKLAKGKLFLPLDSDDACVPETLERFWYHWNNIPDHLRDAFSGVTCLCKDENDNIIGDKFPLDVIDSDELEMPHKYKVRGEKWGFHRTEVLREFPFPELPRMGHMPESIVWNAIAARYKKRFVNEALRTYYLAIPKPDCLTVQMKKSPAQHALGRRLYHKDNLNKYIYWMRHDPVDFCKSAVNYVRFSLHMGISFRKQWRELTNWKAKFLDIVALPVGWLVYLRDRRKVA
jgi:glycosyltransferase involved in cell wall biosynthesis